MMQRRIFREELSVNPTMRIALISDIHGNKIALQAVLDDIAGIGVDQLVCLGDVATLGPDPTGAIRLLQEQNCQCIMGNHDEFLFSPSLIQTYTQAPDVLESIEWCQTQLTSADLDFLRTFEATIELDIGTKLSLFHGSPRSHMENILATTPAKELDEMIGGDRSDILVGGHTHIQMMRQHRGLLIVNAGSVGQPFEEFFVGGTPKLLPHAEYAIVESQRGRVNVTLKRLPLEKKTLLTAANLSGNPMRQWLMEQYT